MLCRSSSIPLSSIFEPVTHLSGSQRGGFRELSFSRRIWVWIFEVGLSQDCSCSLFEAVRFLLTIPNCWRKRVFLAHAVFVDWNQGWEFLQKKKLFFWKIYVFTFQNKAIFTWTKRSSSRRLSFSVMCLKPKSLQLGVMNVWKSSWFYKRIELAIVSLEKKNQKSIHRSDARSKALMEYLEVS